MGENPICVLQDLCSGVAHVRFLGLNRHFLPKTRVCLRFVAQTEVARCPVRELLDLLSVTCVICILSGGGGSRPESGLWIVPTTKVSRYPWFCVFFGARGFLCPAATRVG